MKARTRHFEESDTVLFGYESISVMNQDLLYTNYIASASATFKVLINFSWFDNYSIWLEYYYI